MVDSVKKQNEVVMTRTPLRISFFGGGTDLPEFYQKHGGCVVGMAIDKYVWVMVRRRNDSMIALDTAMGHELCKTADQVQHPLVRSVLEYVDLAPVGVSIWITSDVSPHGCGLGTSSALTLGLLLALLDFSSLSPGPIVNLIEEANSIESQVGPVGKQDTYLCGLGGVKCLQFSKNGFVDPYNVSTFDCFDKLMLFDTGNWRVSTEIQGEAKDEESLLEIKGIAETFFSLDCIQTMFPTSLAQVWERKKKVSASVSNERIDAIYEEGMRSGALAGKLLGAGGGGHFLFYVLPSDQEKVRWNLSQLGVVEIPFGVSMEGVTYQDCS